MECNKEEALRAKEIAEKRMGSSDYFGAKQLALKAQKLYPELENVSQLLLVCDVHCSASKKVNGTDMDWYAILQTERFSSEEVIKKQYRKLALSLHPDKNKLAGAEAAFKLIGEAHRLLTDQTQRSVIDLKLKHCVNIAGARYPDYNSNRNPYGTCAKVPSTSPHLQAQRGVFWTSCQCGVKYQYSREYVNQKMGCAGCKKIFVAYDLNARVGVTNPSSKNPPGAYVGVNLVPKTKPAYVADACGSSTPEGRVNNEHHHVKMEAKPNNDYGGSKRASRKRTANSDEESDDSYDTDSSCEIEHVVNEEVDVNDDDDLTGHQPRRSSRQRQKIVYKESVSDDDDDFTGHPTMMKASRLSSSIKSEEKKDGSCIEKDVKPKSTTPIEEISLKDSTSEEDKDKSENSKDVVDLEDSSVNEENSEEKPAEIEYPDPEFNDFDKHRAESCFKVNQIWSAYDEIDGMPRFYALIKKIYSPGLKLQITWLEPDPLDEVGQDWCEEGLPVACGRYKAGSTAETDSSSFSHQIQVKKISKQSFFIYPSKGETWAVFKNWSPKWKQKTSYNFEYVKVLDNHAENVGIAVAPLRKVKGFVSLYERTERIIVIPSEDIYKFSHLVPSFTMTGTEKEGVPVGAFELDPACLELGDADDCEDGR